MLRRPIRDPDLRAKLAERGWVCHLLLETDASFLPKLCGEIGDLLEAAYHRVPTENDLKYETWCVVIHPPSGPPIACATLSFTSSDTSSFTTRFDAVHPSVQKTGVGRLLFDCVAAWTRVLVLTDVLVREGIILTDGKYFLVACVDADDAEEMDEEDAPQADDDNMEGHGAFLRKLGFVKAQHAFDRVTGDIAFQREFNVPVKHAVRVSCVA